MTTQDTRTLTVLRHAHSPQAMGSADADRELSERGIRDARNAAGAITAPDHVVCSTARRAQQTWRELARELTATPSVTYDPALYGADAHTLLELVRAAGDDVASLLVVGHNPTVHQFTYGLLADEAPVHFPPAALTTVEVRGPWTELDSTRVRFAAHWSPNHT